MSRPIASLIFLVSSNCIAPTTSCVWRRSGRISHVKIFILLPGHASHEAKTAQQDIITLCSNRLAQIPQTKILCTMSAQNRVFGLPEVLEAILLQLPVRDLLTTAQLVNKTWNGAIASSPALQRALFFSPILSEQTDIEFNPLLKWAFPPWFCIQSPFFRDSAFENLPWIASPAKTAAFKRKEASWRKMLPTQPPATVLEVARQEHYQMGSWAAVGKAGFPSGIRMGALYDYAYVVESRPISSFAIEWEGEERQKVRMKTNYTFQCCVDMEPSVGEEFRSEGLELPEVKFGEERSMRW